MNLLIPIVVRVLATAPSEAFNILPSTIISPLPPEIVLSVDFTGVDVAVRAINAAFNSVVPLLKLNGWFVTIYLAAVGALTPLSVK